MDGPGPRAFAHRGWHTGDLAGRENTMAAFSRAVDEGFTFLETDVHATADGVLVAFHDPSLDRVTDTSGRIADLTWEQVAAARVGGRDPIPRLVDLLDAFPDARFTVDAKADPAVDPLLDLLRGTTAADRICVGSFSDRRLERLRRAAPAAVVTSLAPRQVLALVTASVTGRAHRAPDRAVAAQVPMRSGLVPVVTGRFVQTAHAAGLEVHVWTVDDPAQMRRLLDLGVDGIMTDRPDLLRDVLRQRGQWPA
nr:glycerophosphodiester phosphodiesterase [Nakamurella flavida]